MNDVYIIKNQHGHYWGRGKRWVDGRDTTKVLTFSHYDEVTNTVFELSSKDIDLRCETAEIAITEGKLPTLEISTVPLPDDENLSLDLENNDLAPISELDNAALTES